jgi:hypothetical protein
MQAQHTRAARRLNAPIHCCTGPSSGELTRTCRRTGSAAITPPPSPPPTPARPFAMCPVPAEPLECCNAAATSTGKKTRAVADQYAPLQQRFSAEGQVKVLKTARRWQPTRMLSRRLPARRTCSRARSCHEIEASNFHHRASTNSAMCTRFRQICTSVQGVVVYSQEELLMMDSEPFPWNGCPRIGPMPVIPQH